MNKDQIITDWLAGIVPTEILLKIIRGEIEIRN